MTPYVVVGTDEIAHTLLRSLLHVGAPIGAIASRRPKGESFAVDIAPLFDAPVKVKGATVVHHAPLEELSRSLAEHPTPAAERRVAYIDWPRPRFEEQDLAVLLPFDEVWVTTHFQRELACASGLMRSRVHVVEVSASMSSDVLERYTRPRRPAPELLARILAELGLKSPADWLAGSRERVALCPIRSERDDWRAALRRFLLAHGPDDDATLCLWVDTELAPLLERLSLEVQAEIDRSQGPRGPGDVLLLTAPLEHVPWDRVALEPAA